MKKVFTILGGLTLIFITLTLLVIAYWTRPQEIDFTRVMPIEMEFCGQTVDGANANYKELERWFSVNQQGWENTPVSYLPKYEFSSDTMTVNIFNSSVIVNYQHSEKNWSQVVRELTSGLQFEECAKTNNKGMD